MRFYLGFGNYRNIMCGITGYIGLEPNLELLKKMAGIISHRGPDDEGIFQHQNIGMAMRRLSIIDTATGKQPIYNEDRTVAIVFNGEIYNYRELMAGLKARGHRFSTHSDTETIVHLYEEKGIDCVKDLRGMFAFAIYDFQKKIFYLARDRIGIKPLYFYRKNATLLFGSEIKSLLEWEKTPREVHVPSIDSYLQFRFTTGKNTLFAGVERFPAGHWMSYQAGEFRFEKYWDPGQEMVRAQSRPRLSDEEYREQFAALYEETIRIHLESDVPVGSYLSGGLDSSLITAAATKISGKSLKTFCVGFDWEGDETENAKNVAKYLGGDHHEIICGAKDLNFLPQMIWNNDEPVGDPIYLPTFLLSKLASQHVKVVLTGEGADELLAGYLFHRVMLLTHRAKKFFPSFGLNHFVAPAVEKLPVHLIDSVFDYPAFLGEKGRKKVAQFARVAARNHPMEMYEFLIGLFDSDSRTALYREDFAAQAFRPAQSWPLNSDLDFLNNALVRQYHSWLPDNILARQDKMSMAHSVEARVPFLDHRLVEFLYGVPHHLKLDLLKGRNKILARDLGKAYLPPAVSQRKKKAFYIPTENFFGSKEFRALVGETLNEETIKRRGYFRYENIQELLRSAESGQEFMAAKQVFSLISLEIWHQIFLEGKSWR